MHKKRDYGRIVVYLARVENNPKLSWTACRRCAAKYFKLAGFRGLDYCQLKRAWGNFAAIPSRMP